MSPHRWRSSRHSGAVRRSRVPSHVAMSLLGAGLLLAACGGGSDGTGATQAVDGTIAGLVAKGPVADATVTAFAVTAGAKGAQLGTARTDAQGRFTMSVADYSGPVLVEMHGGAYTDEATSATMPMADADVMTSMVPSFAAGSSEMIVVTPLTSMAQAMAGAMAGGMTDANITASNAAVGSYFSVGDILHAVPMDPLVQGSGAGATQDMKNHGMSLAAMSRYAEAIGMATTSSGIVTAMRDDASDGVMNGMMGAAPISMGGMGGMMGGGMMPATSGTSDLARAMAEFVASGMNRSGVTLSEMQPLIDKLAASSGAIE